MRKILRSRVIILFICSCFSSLPDCIAQYRIANRLSLEGDANWDYLLIEPSTSRLFVSHGTMVQVMDVNTGKIIATIPDTKGVHGIALAEDLNKGFISNGKDTSVTIFNLKTLGFIAKVKVTGINPDAILYDQFSQQVFVYNGKSNNATVMDAKSNTVIETIPLSGKPEFSISDGNRKVYVNIEDRSMIAVINPTTLKVEQEWPIAPGKEPSGIALDNINHLLFVVCANKLMVVLNAQTGKMVTTIPIGENADGAAFDPALKRIYSSNGEGTVTIVQEKDATHFAILEKFATQKGARTIAVDTITHHIYLPTAEYGNIPEATSDNPHPRPPIKPGTFVILDIEPGK